MKSAPLPSGFTLNCHYYKGNGLIWEGLHHLFPLIPLIGITYKILMTYRVLFFFRNYFKIRVNIERIRKIGTGIR